MPVQPRSRLKKLLARLQPSECLLVADVTRTILYQRPDGFSRQMQSLIATYTKAGGILLAVSGDSFETIKAHFLRPFSRRRLSNCFIITGAGSRIDSVYQSRTKCIYHGPVIKRQTRCDLLEAMEEVLSAEFDTHFSFSSRERQKLLSTRGERLEVAKRLKLLEPFYVEIRPEKGGTLFLEGSSNYGGHKSTVLKRFANHPRVREIAKSEGLHISSGADYTDIITATKYDALDTFFRLEQAAKLGLNTRAVVAIGDSFNDAGLFSFPYVTNRQAINVFVGDDEKFFRNVRRQSPASHSFHLSGEFTLGTEFVLGQLCNGI